jgi:putative hydrolase of the HAD superfamily
MICLVTFDFWETLVADSAENLAAQQVLRLDGLRAALARAGAPLSPEAAAGGYQRSQDLLVERYWSRHRDPSYREQVRLVLDCLAPGAAARMPEPLFEEAVSVYISPVLAHPPALMPGAAAAVQALVARGVRLGIVSNTGRTPGVVLRQVLAAHGLLQHFSAIGYSDEVGYRKPEAEIFRHVLAAAGAMAAEAAHIGDNPVADVAGARAAGLRGIHYAPRGDAAADADLVVADLAALPDLLLRG